MFDTCISFEPTLVMHRKRFPSTTLKQCSEFTLLAECPPSEPFPDCQGAIRIEYKWYNSP